MSGLSAIWTMTSWDLRQRVRDRSVLLFGLVVPLALMAVFNLLFSGTESGEALDPVTVAMAGDDSDQLAQALSGVLQSLGDGGMDVTLTERSPDAARSAVADGDADLAVIVPEGFQQAVSTGGSPTVEVVNSGDGTLESQVVTSVVDGFVDQLAVASQAAGAAVAGGLSPEQAGEIAAQVGQASPSLTTSAGETADEQLSMKGNLVAGQAALFMLFTVSFGVIAYLYERETGTLARLEAMPIRPGWVLLAKTLVSFLLGVLATAILLAAGSLLFDVDFGAILPIGVLVIATVAAATSLVLLVAKVARTAEQAQVMQTILALVLGILGGSFFPMGGTGLLARLSDLTPPGSFIRGLGITHAGGGLADLGGPLAAVVGFGVVTVVLWVLLPEREMAT